MSKPQLTGLPGAPPDLPSLVDADMVSAGSNITYDDLFSDDFKKQEAAATILEKRFIKRKNILKET